MDKKDVKVTMGILVDLEDVPHEISNFLSNSVGVKCFADMLDNNIQNIENMAYQQNVEKIEKSLEELNRFYNLSVKFSNRLGMVIDLVKSYKSTLDAMNNQENKIEIKQEKEYDDLPF